MTGSFFVCFSLLVVDDSATGAAGVVEAEHELTDGSERRVAHKMPLMAQSPPMTRNK